MKFTVQKSTLNQKGGFVNTLLVDQKVKTAFGTTNVKATYYLTTDEQLTAGQEIEASLEMFVVKEYEMVNPQTGETFMGKRLFVDPTKADKLAKVASTSETATIAETAVA